MITEQAFFFLSDLIEMPRQKDEIWRKFNEVILPNGSTRAECKLCKNTIVGLVVRMKSHFQDCSTRHAAQQATTSTGVSTTQSPDDDNSDATPAKISKQGVFSEETGIHVYGCSAHFANLLAKDVCNTTEGKAVLAKILHIVKYLRNTHAAIAKLNEKQMTKPPIPAETRWSSQQATIKYFVENWVNIVAVDLLDVLNPITEALNLLQGEKTTISEATEIWKALLDKCPGSFKEHTVKRMNEALSPPLLAANLLDSHFQGASLTSSENVKGLEYIRLCKADIMPDVMKFLAKEDPFVPSVFENFKEASTTSWWKLGLRMGFPEGIVQFALSLLPAVCSSAGLERQFSTMGYTYGSLRTQLGVERAGKMSFLYRQLNK